MLLLLVGDDWAEDHHDVEIMDPAGRTLAKARLPEGIAGLARLHALIAGQLGDDAEQVEVRIGIETDRGPWVAALTAPGYTVYAVNPLQAARYRDRHAVSGAKSDAADAHALLAKAPDPTAATRLTRAQISAALRRGRRRDVDTKTTAIRAALRTPQLGRPAVVVAAYAATTRAAVAVLATLNAQITALEAQVGAHFRRHPDAEIILSQPGMGPLLGARVLGEFGDAPGRYADAKARKNYAGTSPITRASGRRKTVHARHVHNDRLVDALMLQAQSALQASPGARAYYDRQRARSLDHNPALRQLANRLVGILHGCLKTRTRYDEATAWSHHNQDQQTAA